jgi:hypothetical protein
MVAFTLRLRLPRLANSIGRSNQGSATAAARAHGQQDLKLCEGEEFRGEGILAITKALLQSGVSYVGGYQGAPISHLMDVLADAKDVLDELDHAAFAVAILAQGIGVEAVGRQHWSENTRAGQRKGSTSAELRRERDVRNYINIGNG